MPYLEIVKAALVPALPTPPPLAVHPRPGAAVFSGSRARIRQGGKALAARWYLALPLAVLVYVRHRLRLVGLALTVLPVIAGSMALGIGSQAI